MSVEAPRIPGFDVQLQDLRVAGLPVTRVLVAASRATVLMVHGAFSARTHLHAWATRFAERGYSVVVPSLPGHEPSSEAAVAKLTLNDYVASLRALVPELAQPLAVLGHSMGGLVSQRLASEVAPVALILVGAAPPWRTAMQFRSLPALAPLLPRVLAGRPIRPERDVLERLVLHDLSAQQRAEVETHLAFESGRAFRALVSGGLKVPAEAVRCPVLYLAGSADRLISLAEARSIAKYYSADLREYARGHWLIGGPLSEQIAADAIDWLDRLLPA